MKASYQSNSLINKTNIGKNTTPTIKNAYLLHHVRSVGWILWIASAK
jgi:hypothetical protein